MSSSANLGFFLVWVCLAHCYNIFLFFSGSCILRMYHIIVQCKLWVSSWCGFASSEILLGSLPTPFCLRQHWSHSKSSSSTTTRKLTARKTNNKMHDANFFAIYPQGSSWPYSWSKFFWWTIFSFDVRRSIDHPCLPWWSKHNLWSDPKHVILLTQCFLCTKLALK